MKAIRYAVAAAMGCALALAVPAAAQDFPLAEGEYVDVGQITIDDGHSLDYAQFLATTWRKQQDFMKKQGWISSYQILANVHKRPGEPDLYLFTWSNSLPDAKELARRNDVMRKEMKMTDAEAEAASGERSKYRHIVGGQLLQVLNFK